MSASLPVVVLDGVSLAPAAVVRVARGRAVAEMSDEARERNLAAERLVLELVERGELMYGVTTGVGVLRRRRRRSRCRASTSAGCCGRTRAAAARSCASRRCAPRWPCARTSSAPAGRAWGTGYQRRLGALRAGITPVARELGSLGTGDLTVLAEIALAVGGEGSFWVGDDVVPAAEALRAAGLEPVLFGPRDGIGFMSSNAVSTAQAALVFHDASRLLDSALRVAALSYEATGADLAVLDPRVHAARPHWGQGEVARRLRGLLGEGARPAHEDDGRPIHDAFVFRCVPQVEGTLLEALRRLLGVLEVELNVAGENALMLPRDGVALPNGNFHAGVLTLALDSLRGAMAQSASLIAARVSALLDPDVTGLTPQLARNPGPIPGR